MKVKLKNGNFQSDYLKKLLNARGITDVENYLHPTEENLNSPYGLMNTAQGKEWLLEALDKPNSDILIVVD